MVGVDRDKKSPGLTVDVAYMPTLIMTRKAGGPDASSAREVGRIVENAPNGIEKDLLSLPDGTASGVITCRQDLAQSPRARPERVVVRWPTRRMV